MADRESLMREAQRQMMEKMQQRPRPADDTPMLNAWFPHQTAPLADGAEALTRLMAALQGRTPYTQSWRIVRNAEDHAAATGLDPLRNTAGYVDHLRGTEGKSDGFYTISALAFSDRIFPDDPREYAAQLTWSGGMELRRSDTLNLTCTLEHKDNNLTYPQWLDVIAAICAWRRPSYIAIGSHPYTVHDRVYPHRAWAGWMGWFPTRIDRAILPAFALTEDIADGTLVAAQDSSVLTRHEDQLARAHQLEIALAEAGLLPTVAALN